MAVIDVGYYRVSNSYVACGYTTIATAYAAATNGDKLRLFYAYSNGLLRFPESLTIASGKFVSIVSGIEQDGLMPGLNIFTVANTQDLAGATVLLDGIQLASISLALNAAGTGFYDIRNCVFLVGTNNASFSWTGNATGPSTATALLRNCFATSGDVGFYSASTAAQNQGSVTCINCTCGPTINASNGFRNVTCHNCLSFGGNGTSSYYGCAGSINAGVSVPDATSTIKCFIKTSLADARHASLKLPGYIGPHILRDSHLVGEGVWNVNNLPYDISGQIWRGAPALGCSASIDLGTVMGRQPRRKRTAMNGNIRALVV